MAIRGKRQQDLPNNRNALLLKVSEYRKQNLHKSSMENDSETNPITFEELVSGLSARFSNLNPNDLEEEINLALQLLVEFLALDRSTLFEFDLVENLFTASFSFARPGIKRIETGFGAELFPYTFEILKQERVLFFNKYEELPNEAKDDIENFKKFNLRSGFIVPILINGSVKYALAGGITSDNKREWKEDLFTRIRFIGEIISAAIEKKKHLSLVSELFNLNQNLSKELQKFLPQNKIHLDPGKIEFKKHKDNKSKSWLFEGICYYAECGRIDLNKICERIQLAKSSFYNKYPNLDKSKGLERYQKEVIDHISQELDSFFIKAEKLVKSKNEKEARIEIVDIACADIVLFNCLGQMMINKSDPYIIMHGKQLNNKLEALVSLWLDNATTRKQFSTIERKGIEQVVVNNIYHQALLFKPKEWRKQIVKTLEHIKSFLN